MTYASLQERVYDNKVRKNFNVTDIRGELVNLTEEHGELCAALLDHYRSKILDAIGDIMVYCLGLCSMFKWNADDVLVRPLDTPHLPSLQTYQLQVARELGRAAKTYKRSNKRPVATLDRRDDFRAHVGNLMGYCSAMFTLMNADEQQVLESIVAANVTRSHDGRISEPSKD